MIDWTRISDLKAEIGPDDFDEVIAMFMDEVDETIAKLQSAPHPGSLEEDLHFIRSAALNIGFADLARACQEGESAAAARQEVDLAGLFALYHASRAAFANLP